MEAKAPNKEKAAQIVGRLGLLKTVLDLVGKAVTLYNAIHHS